MGEARYFHHQKLDKWRLFEEDHDEWQRNRDKYHGITPRPENYTFFFRWKGRQIKYCQRLADIYEFKLKYEAENEALESSSCLQPTTSGEKNER